jgi:TolB-like protein
MSPEQARGPPADERSDIFSFGLVLYEMLSERRAFSSESPVATALAVVKDEPSPLQASASLEKIVRRCLAKQPSGRYQTMAEVGTALEQVFAEKESAASAEPQPSIAVMPFVNMSGDKEQEYFSDGLAEEIINALTKIPGLKVIARTSSFSFRAKETDIAQIRDRLKVQNILEGSVRKSGNRLRVTAQLIDTSDESHLWSERYDRETGKPSMASLPQNTTAGITPSLGI